MTAVPMLTAEQRREALRQAMAARAARKQVLDAIAQEQETTLLRCWRGPRPTPW
jgi:hypothetical protein